MDQFEALIQEQWEEYQSILRSNGIESPHTWYFQELFLDEYDGIDGSEDYFAQLKEFPLHILYRTTTYRDQPFVLLAHNPEVKLKEIHPHEDNLEFEDEIGELQQLDSVSASAFGEITEPNWAKWLYNKAKKKKVDGGTEYGTQFGYLLKMLNKHTAKLSLPEQPESYFEPDSSTLNPVFEDFYYTNAFKLPTPTGIGDAALRSNNRDFYVDLLQSELKATDARVVFPFGSTAFESIQDKLNTVEDTNWETPRASSTTITTAHGHLYYWPAANMHVIPLLHHASRASWSGDSETGQKRARRLRDSIKAVSRHL